MMLLDLKCVEWALVTFSEFESHTVLGKPPDLQHGSNTLSCSLCTGALGDRMFDVSCDFLNHGSQPAEPQIPAKKGPFWMYGPKSHRCTKQYIFLLILYWNIAD